MKSVVVSGLALISFGIAGLAYLLLKISKTIPNDLTGIDPTTLQGKLDLFFQLGLTLGVVAAVQLILVVQLGYLIGDKKKPE